MDDDQHELSHLQLGNVLFPPEQRFEPVKGGQGVVRVHDGVDERVEHWEESGIATGRKLQSDPTE